MTTSLWKIPGRGLCRDLALEAERQQLRKKERIHLPDQAHGGRVKKKYFISVIGTRNGLTALIHL